MMSISKNAYTEESVAATEEDFTITEEDLEQIDEADLNRITEELEKAHAEYDAKMKEIYNRQKDVVSRIHQMIDQKKIDGIYSKLQKDK